MSTPGLATTCRTAVTTVLAGLCTAISMAAPPAPSPFGTTKDGVPVQLYTLTNRNGMKAEITNYGATVVRLLVPDRNGKLDDVVLGFPTLDGYTSEAFRKSNPYFGAIVGRYGNRIAHASFTLEGKTYQLAANNTPGGLPCSLHGGTKGFDQVVWKAAWVTRKGTDSLEMRYVSKDGEEGYPGTLDVTVSFSLTASNDLKIQYRAKTDKATPVNLTHHGYFNLRGEGRGDILGHQLTLKASRFTPVDKGLIPTGELRSVKGTPFDFLAPHAIGERIGTQDEQLGFGAGYDHNWVIDRKTKALALAASVFEPTSGRTMEVFTTEPGIQFYAGNFLDGTLVGKGGQPYPKRSGFCLETQHYPDSPNQPGFPTTILQPGQVYRSTTVYHFGTKP
ncbi:aldose 1-epimerase [Geothrix limicola]|uniref:Aldose 1-epimerase n=1 Tax=Geothrix limicola TaxID=2927978 RepID=A0ABQ5QAV2_9BACT|nr:aldose epimerase family protein [Geothrix limicola]GLH71747.1 aldose 1-epimerase [Geothrix limicola]